MGTKIFELIAKKEISIEELNNKIIVIDTSLYLYQFLATIRQADGSLLTDSNGNVTSHLVGLFSRTTNLMEHGLKLAFCFDGKPPELKIEEQQRRKEVKIKSQTEYEAAKQRKNIELMKKYASRTSKLTNEMVQEAKDLLTALGLPVIQAPSEGEAQASFIVKNGDAYAVSTNDADCLLFGTPRLIKNLSVSQKKKMPGKSAYVSTKPQLIELKSTLTELEINQDQLIALAILVGTDYNYGGIKGIGHKTALKLVKEYKNDFNSLFKKVDWDKYYEFSWQKIFSIIKNMPVTKDYKLQWDKPNTEAIKKLLCEKHDFTEQSVENKLSKIKSKTQKGLSQFF